MNQTQFHGVSSSSSMTHDQDEKESLLLVVFLLLAVLVAIGALGGIFYCVYREGDKGEYTTEEERRANEYMERVIEEFLCGTRRDDSTVGSEGITQELDTEEDFEFASAVVAENSISVVAEIPEGSPR